MWLHLIFMSKAIGRQKDETRSTSQMSPDGNGKNQISFGGLL
jgi:hypothetical protein